MFIGGFSVHALTGSSLAFGTYMGIVAALMLVRPQLFPMDRAT